MVKFFLNTTMLLVLSSTVLAQSSRSEWVDSVFRHLTMKEKIKQLFIVPVDADKAENADHGTVKGWEGSTLGGVLIMRGGIDKTSRLIDRLQRSTPVPPFIGVSMNGGLPQVLDSIPVLRSPMAIAAIGDKELLYRAGVETAQQMKALGIQINFFVDKHTEQLSLSDHSKNNIPTVFLPSFMRGLHQSGISIYANAFTSDNKSYDKTDGILFSDKPVSISGTNKQRPPPSTFHSTIKRLRKRKFNGLIFVQTDSLYLRKKALPGEHEKRILMAGGNIFIAAEQIGKTIQSIEDAATKNVIFRKKLYADVKKILAAKYAAGIVGMPGTAKAIVPEELNVPGMQMLRNKLAAASITVAQNDIDRIPIRTLNNRRFASLSIGMGKSDNFNHYLNKFAPFTRYSIRHIRDTTSIYRKLQDFDVIVISMYNLDIDLRTRVIPWINRLKMKEKIILCAFSNPYDLSHLEKIPSVVVAYTDEDPVPMLAAQLIFGACQGRGKLPIGLNSWLTKGQGVGNTRLDRLGYNHVPESVGMDGATLEKIDRVAQIAIDSGATPGCVVLVAKNGKVIFERSYGWHTYAKKKRVKEDDIYDLASITKVAATLQAIATLYDSKRIDVDKKASVYLPNLKHSNKKDIIVKDILTHQAGLWPFLKYWKKTVSDSSQRSYYYDTIASEGYPFPVAKNMFARYSMRDSLWQWTIHSKLRKKKPNVPYDYLYSDIGFYIMHHLAEKQLNQPMEEFLDQHLYKPLGAYTMGYLPLNRFPIERVVPTEKDTYFRHSTLVGFVDDQGAAMSGGVAGHAGLFSDANDLAKIGQLWLQYGHYGGVRYFDSTTVREFTRQQYPSNRRGLGWDKPVLDDWYGPTSTLASPKTFGHTGFTGTAIWIDPVFNTVFVFLSNHIYPDAGNKKLLTLNIRTRIQDIIYFAIFNHCYRYGRVD